MSHTVASRSRIRTPLGLIAAGFAVVVAAIFGCLALQPASSAAPPADQSVPDGYGLTGTVPSGIDADGALPHEATVFDEAYPAISQLDPALLSALRDAAMASAADGIEVTVNSGWRSAQYQDRLFREAVIQYGSEQEAARWVATADTSAHVSGDAVDIGPYDAAAWMSERGAQFGLCQIYDNEPWHFELRPTAIAEGCPRMYFDATSDPRMQR